VREGFLVFGSPLIGDAEIDEVVDSLRSGWIGTGPKVQRFERMLEAYVGIDHIRCLSSCTAALALSMEVAGIGPGDEVIVPAMTFVASANAVVHTGAIPVLVDSEPTGLVDLEAVEAALTPQTKAMLVVHFAGRPLDMDRVNALRDRHGLIVVEDAAHALGAEWRGRRIGGHGNVTAYSFYATKNITTGEGGALATDDADMAAAVEGLALHGLSLGAWRRFSDAGFKHYECVAPGYKYNMTDVEAALGIHQLPHLDEWIDRRSELWRRYDELLANLPVTLPPPADPDTRHARHLYQILVGADGSPFRDNVVESLFREGIGTGIHYRGVHLHPYYRDRWSLDPAAFPVATEISDHTVSLPFSPKISERDQERVAAALARALARSAHVSRPSEGARDGSPSARSAPSSSSTTNRGRSRT
jgi:dTDP-4-amino-4,6-dideoxygalactose transaminase